MTENMYLIVGLGNPGKEYEKHRHNVGFMALEAIARTLNADRATKKFHGMVAGTTLGDRKLVLLEPHTYMNHSGRAVRAAAAFYKIAPENILVLHDELDLPVGKIRIKKGGGANGQNGIRDIDSAIGKEYWRCRIGIGHPGDKTQVHGHVLSNFGKDEKAVIEKLLEALSTHFPLYYKHSPEALMSKVTEALTPPRPPTRKLVDKEAPTS